MIVKQNETILVSDIIFYDCFSAKAHGGSDLECRALKSPNAQHTQSVSFSLLQAVTSQKQLRPGEIEKDVTVDAAPARAVGWLDFLPCQIFLPQDRNRPQKKIRRPPGGDI